MVHHRLEKVASFLKQEVSRIILYELADPALGFVTVTSVKPSADLQSAKVYFSVLGDEAQIQTTLHGLRRARGHIQELLAKRKVLRYIPRLSFFYDDTVSNTARLHKLIEETKETPAAPPETDS